MKNAVFLLLVFYLYLNSSKAIAQTSSSRTNERTSPFVGAWTSIDNKEFKVMSDGFFSSVAQDLTGRWAATHAGTYTVDNANTLTLNVLSSSFADRVGALHSVEYAVNGENLTIKLFKKLVDPKQGNITARMPKNTQSQYVRAKNN